MLYSGRNVSSGGRSHREGWASAVVYGMEGKEESSWKDAGTSRSKAWHSHASGILPMIRSFLMQHCHNWTEPLIRAA